MMEARGRLAKLGSLMASLAARPEEFCDRVGMLVDVRLQRLRTPGGGPDVDRWPEALGRLRRAAGHELARHLTDPALDAFTARMRRRVAEMSVHGVLSPAHNADWALARLCFALCRAFHPETALETGVAYGVTSAFVLLAMARNDFGVLHSVDLPVLGSGAADLVGLLIPEELRGRWRLHRGASRRLLPPLLDGLGRVDMFVHDSLHTYRNMRRELGMVRPFLARPSVVVADDIDGHRAFTEWTDSVDTRCRAVLREEDKDALMGVCVLL